MGTLDLLLSDEAAVLWRDHKSDTTPHEEAKELFVETLTITKSITDRIFELVAMKEDVIERFAKLEMLVNKLLETILSSGLLKKY